MKYKYILFDLDGTLIDPKIGITKSVQYALNKFSITEDNLFNLEKFIGPPLKNSFMDFYEFNEDNAMQAIDYYREYFTDKGILENSLYNGIKDLLSELKSRGIILAVATSKPTIFAKRIIENYGLNEYFDIIAGSNLDNTRVDKNEIINYVLEQLRITDKSEAVMIGDRKHDIIGAKKNNIDSIGVLYGYGSVREIEEIKPTYIVESVMELNKLLMGAK